MRICIGALLLVLTLTQNYNTLKTDTHINTPYHTCNSQGCTTHQGAMTIEASWRWLHYIQNYDNCQNGGNWDSRYCPDPKTCA